MSLSRPRYSKLITAITALIASVVFVASPAVAHDSGQHYDGFDGSIDAPHESVFSCNLWADGDNSGSLEVNNDFGYVWDFPAPTRAGFCWEYTAPPSDHVYALRMCSSSGCSQWVAA